MPSEVPLADAARWLQVGAGRAYSEVVRRTYRSLTGEASRGHPLDLVARLSATDRLSPEAVFLLLSVGQALDEVGALGAGAPARSALRGAFRAVSLALR